MDSIVLASLLIKQWESFEPAAYPDPASQLGRACTARRLPMRAYTQVQGWEGMDGGPWTVGWGFTGSGIGPSTTMTLEQADERLKSTLGWLWQRLDHAVGRDLNINQTAALLSLAYNIGLGALERSSVWSQVQDGAWLPAANSILLYDKVRLPSGALETSRGLQARRKAERDLFIADPPVKLT